MEYDSRDSRYEKLYEELRSRAELQHQRNKQWVKYGSIGLVILPVILFTVRWLTDSDKVVFLLLWVLCTALLAIFLIGVEYLDHTVQKTLEDITDREAEFDGLIQPPTQLKGRIVSRISSLPERFDLEGMMKMYGLETEEETTGPDAQEMPKETAGPEVQDVPPAQTKDGDAK